jgi:hypothetical protein
MTVSYDEDKYIKIAFKNIKELLKRNVIKDLKDRFNKDESKKLLLIHRAVTTVLNTANSAIYAGNEFCFKQMIHAERVNDFETLKCI